MQQATDNSPSLDNLDQVLARFTKWLEGYGEVSFDHQSFFAGPIGGRAKGLYYRHKLLGTAAVAPMIFCEAFLPAARKMFYHAVRFPIADAHYAMGFAFLYEALGDSAYFDRSVHFLEELKKSRCEPFKEYGWGYPFDWVTRNGIITAQTPLITTTPYVYEAFLAAYKIEPRSEWKSILESIARHAISDIKDFKTSDRASTCSYGPYDKGGVINAASYRAGMLASAAKVLTNEEYWKIGERNMYFVLENQNADGSWPYAVDGVRDFVDHFHTCFVMKGLAKVHSITGNKDCLAGLAKGVDYYLNNLFAEDGLPRPFSKAPRLTVYKRELYDCAECINLCLLLRDRFPKMNPVLQKVVKGILRDWVQANGSFRARQLMFGWDNVPMHRWAQSQMFRSLAFYLREEKTANVKISKDNNHVRDLRPA